MVHVDLGDPERRIVIEAEQLRASSAGRDRASPAWTVGATHELVADSWRLLRSRVGWHVMFERDRMGRIVRASCLRASRSPW